jgi:beta-1,4-mannosyl-glycoprotein beta-1,4-N-acetylglucosaminyltransferase
MVIDSFTFFNELDILEMRLEILDPYVDFFILTESTETFSGKPKPLYYAENKERFKKWDKKIVHNVVSGVEATDSFDRAFKQKESIKDAIQGFCHNDTIVFYGDVDEIWNPMALKHAAETGLLDDETKVYNLEQLNYCYYLNQRSSERWVGTVMGRWGIIKTNTLAHWRATHTTELPNAGWHFTNMGGADQIRKKIEAYDHQEFNFSEVKESIERKMRYGADYVGRQVDWEGKPFLFTVDESQLPSYIINNKQKYVAYFK